MLKKDGKILDSKDDVLERAYKLQNIDDWEEQFRSLLVKNDEKILVNWLCERYREDDSRAILFIKQCSKVIQQKVSKELEMSEFPDIDK